MRTTPHSWRAIQAAAIALGVRFQANALLGGSNIGVQVKAARERSQELITEAEALQAKADQSTDGLLAGPDQARWDAIMTEETGELAVAQAKLAALEATDRQRKDLALAKTSGACNPFGEPIATGGYLTEGKPKMRLKNAETGREIRTYAADESLLDNIQDRTSASREESLDRFGEGIRGLLTGETRGISGAFTSSDAAGGFLVEHQTAAAITDLARSQTVALRAGAITVPMDSPELNLVQVAEDPATTWRPEFGKVSSSDAKFKRLTMRLKSLATIVPVSLELMEDARANVADAIVNLISAAMAQAVDSAILSGSGVGSVPKGIRNEAGVNTVTGVGTPSSYSQVSSAIQSIYSNNFAGEPSSLAWVMNPRDAGTYDGLVDSTGQPLQPTPWAKALQKYPTTSLEADLGDGNDESEMIVGDFSQVLLGTRSSGIQVRILDSGSVSSAEGQEINAVSQLAKLIVVSMRADVGIVRPNWLSVLSGVTSA